MRIVSDAAEGGLIVATSTTSYVYVVTRIETYTRTIMIVVALCAARRPAQHARASLHSASMLSEGILPYLYGIYFSAIYCCRDTQVKLLNYTTSRKNYRTSGLPMMSLIVLVMMPHTALSLSDACVVGNGTMKLERYSSVSGGKLLPGFLFMQGESDGLEQSLGVRTGGGRGEPIPFVPDEIGRASCRERV